MKLKNYQIIRLLEDITKLDPDLGKPEQPTDTVRSATVPKYKFKASTLYALARNYRKVQTAAEDIQRTRQALYRKYAGEEPDATGELKGDAARDFVKEFNSFIESEGPDITFVTVKYTDLDLDKNNIPIKDVSGLIGTIVEDSE